VREVPADEWDDLLTELGCADAYLLRAYVEASCVLDPCEPVLLEAQGAVMACIVRPIPESDLHDVTTPYGYGGPVGGGSGFFEEYETWCTERGIVSTFVRYHPLFENYRGGGFNASYASPTVAWQLDGELLAGMHGKHRNTVRKAQRAGVAVEAAPSADLRTFAALYESTMQRQEAAPYYFFPPAYWERLGALGDRLVLFDAIHKGEIVASALCMRGDRWLHYHLGATHDSARDLGASNLLLYTAALWGQEQGLETFHLGGGAGGHEDSLFAFKRRFSADGLREFWTGRAVHDEHAYRELSGGDDLELDGFFPAYRR
jgi:serine/alanine adding enzyme